MNRKKVLIIEDEPEIRTILAMSLQHTGGFAALTAKNGAEGIRLAERHVPDLILVDALMPSMDGYETCRQIRENPKLKNVPVVFLTAKNDPAGIEKAVAAGATACLGKPFDPMVLGSRIKSIIEDKREEQ